jgi:hypothetical protein
MSITRKKTKILKRPPTQITEEFPDFMLGLQAPMNSYTFLEMMAFYV